MAASYWVIGADGREYGPVALPDLTRWIAEGRIIGTSRVRSDLHDWTEARLVSEIAAHFPGGAPVPGAAASGYAAPHGFAAPGPFAMAGPIQPAALPAEFRAWTFIGLAWDIVKIHWLTLAAMMFILFAIGCVPYLGTCVQLIIGGALAVGIWRAILGMIDGRPPEIGMMFGGFDRFGDGFLAYLVRLILVGLGYLLLIVPGVILSLMWAFTFPVLAETRLGFWEAMHRSAVLTEGYRWRLFLLALACFPIILLGLVVLCFGLLVAVPVCMTAFGLAYRWLVARKGMAPGAAATPQSPAAPQGPAAPQSPGAPLAPGAPAM
jgi:uncharacterized membrane protein